MPDVSRRSLLRGWVRDDRAAAYRTREADLCGMAMLWLSNGPGGVLRFSRLIREPKADEHVHGRDCDCDHERLSAFRGYYRARYA